MSNPPVLDPAVRDLLCSEGAEVAVPAGEPLARAAAPVAFVVVLEGQVEVDRAGCGPDLRGPGCTLGEASIFAGEGQPLAAVARTDVRILSFPAAWLESSLDRLPGLRAHVLACLGRECAHAWSEVRDLHRREQAAQRVAKAGLQSGPLIARSRAMRAVERQVGEAAASPAPITILGERGTGKTFVATKIYEAGCPPESPFIEVDCRRLDARTGPEILFGGCADPSSGPYGAVQLAHGGVLLLRHVDCLPTPCQPLLLRCLAASGEEGGFPRTRLLCTSRQDLLTLAAAGRFHGELATALLRRVLRLPTMEQRRRDIPDLTNHFLEERHDGSRVSKDAAAVLYSRAYPTYHVGELKGVVSFAAVMANGGAIRAHHLIGERRSHALDIDPARASAPLRWLTLGPGLRLLRTLSAVSFGAILLATSLAPKEPIGRAANALVWAFWEPLLIFSFLFLGRLWCAVCPLALPGLGLQRALGLGRRVPPWLRERGPYLAAAGIVLICLAGHIFEMRSHPARTSALLLTLIGLAAVCGLAFERHAWCQHLCPMGTLAGTFSNAASLRVWANPWFCASRCHNAPCLHGDGRSPGCPTFHHPNQATTSSQCKFCLNCLKLCPEQAVTIQVDLPVARLGASTTLDARLTPALLSLVSLSLLMMASDRFPWSHSGLGLVLGSGVAVALGVASTRALHRAFRRETATDSSLPPRLAGGLLVLAWGALAADQLQHLSWLEVVRVGLAEGGSLSRGVGMVLVLQLAVLPASALAAGCVLRSARERLRRLGGETRPWKWALLYALVGLHLASSVGLTLAGR